MIFIVLWLIWWMTGLYTEVRKWTKNHDMGLGMFLFIFIMTSLIGPIPYLAETVFDYLTNTNRKPIIVFKKRKENDKI